MLCQPPCLQMLPKRPSTLNKLKVGAEVEGQLVRVLLNRECCQTCEAHQLRASLIKGSVATVKSSPERRGAIGKLVDFEPFRGANTSQSDSLQPDASRNACKCGLNACSWPIFSRTGKIAKHVNAPVVQLPDQVFNASNPHLSRLAKLRNELLSHCFL